MADAGQRSFVAFLKDGAFVPARRCRRLFLELFTLSAVLSVALYLFKCAALALAGAATDGGELESYYLRPQDMDIARVLHFIATWLPSDHHRLLPLAYLIVGLAVVSVTYIATVSAAVMARSNAGGEEQEQEQHTLPSFLRKVKSNPVRPARTLVVGCFLRVALLLLIGEACQQLHPNVIYPVAFVYLLVQFVCSVAVVASVAEEPGKGTALGRACRLMQPKYCREYVLYLAGMLALVTAVSEVRDLVAMVGYPAGGVVDACITFLLLSAKEVLSVGNVTGYYFACRDKEEHKDSAAGHLD